MDTFETQLEKAKAGDVDAMFGLSLAYKDGIGTAQDDDQFFLWAKKAAEAGNHKAMHNLGHAYKLGHGTPFNPEQHFYWTKKAAEAGNPRSMNNLGLAYKDGVGTAPDIDLYFAWIKKAAETGLNSAMFNLGLAYEKGLGTEPDVEQAFAWIKKAAEAGHPSAMYNLALAFIRGKGTATNPNQYFFWLNKAVEAGHVKSMYPLAVAHLEGTGTLPNEEQYFAWTKKAAEAGHLTSMFNLALAYYLEQGTAYDLDQYFDWTKKAAKAGHGDAALIHYINHTLKENNLGTKEIVGNFIGLFIAVDKIRDAHIIRDDKINIAHFTNFQTLEKMLPISGTNQKSATSNHFRLYNAEYLNDPHEGCRLFQHMKQSKKYNRVYKTLFDSLDRMSPISLLHEDLSVYVCSLTLRSDRLDLWRAYGRDGEGVCIMTPISAFECSTKFHTLGEHLKEINNSTESFDDKQTEEKSNFQTVPRVLYQVKYKDADIEKTQKELQPFLTRIATSFSTLSNSQKNALKKCAISVLCDILFLYKNTEYENEEEARLVFAAGINHPMLELDEQTPGKLFVRTDNFLYRHKESSIIVGPKVRDKKGVELNLKFRLTKHGLHFAKVKHSQVAYR